MIINAVRRTMRSCCGHGGANRSAGEVRASAPIRVLVAVIAALLAVQFMPGVAYADSINAQIISGPSAVPFANMYGASIAAPDRYTAVALLMGYGPDVISNWDDDVRAKLSNEGTGGNFYTFASDSVQNYFDVTEHTGMFQDFLNFVGGTLWNTAQTLYGNNLWAALYTSDELALAKADLERVLSGENIGGGGGSGVDGDYWVFDFKSTSGPLANIKTLYVSKSGFTFSGSLLGFENAIMSGCIKINSYDTNHNTLSGSNFKLCSDPALETYVTDGLYSYVRNHEDTYFCSVSGGTWSVVKVEGDAMYVAWADSPVNLDYKYSYQNTFISNSTNNVGVMVSSSGSGSDPVVPPTNWPDEPEAPEPPELPEPGTNPTVTPTPWAPVISPTLDFDLNITTEPTSNDLIDWVKKIYFELRSFHSDEQDWFDEVGKGIDGLVDAINDAQEQIYEELQTIDDTLRSEGQKIRDYMYQMFHWLKDQLNFQNDTFNDSNIVYWLKRIWSKLGDGDINVRPVDPTVDPPAWWEWLNKMLDSLLDGLVGVFNELLGGTGDLLEEVIHQFPFSIPWDIAAFLTALAAPPVTPVFDIVIPAVNGWWTQITFHIDMTPYNTAAATVRLMTKLVFAGLLAWKSRELLNMMDVTKW